MTIQQLEYIIALDNHRHFVKAAEKCFVTQPTITTQVKKLEEEIGLIIFDRKKHPLEPTPAGLKVLERARTILDDVNILKAMVNDELDSVEGEFRLGIIPTIAPYIVPQFINYFTENYPNTKLHIDEMRSEEIIIALKKDGLDLAIMVTPLEESNLREIPVYFEPFLVYTNELHPLYKEKSITVDDIKLHSDIWLLSDGHCFKNQVLSLCGNDYQDDNNNIKYESGSVEALKNIVDTTGGYTLIPEMAKTGIPNEKLIRFKDNQPVREVSLVVHNTFSKEGVIDATRKAILSSVPKEFEKNERFIKVKWR